MTQRNTPRRLTAGETISVSDAVRKSWDDPRYRYIAGVTDESLAAHFQCTPGNVGTVRRALYPPRVEALPEPAPPPAEPPPKKTGLASAILQRLGEIERELAELRQLTHASEARLRVLDAFHAEFK